MVLRENRLPLYAIYLFFGTRAILKATHKLTKENICSLSISRNSFQRGFGRFMRQRKTARDVFRQKSRQLLELPWLQLWQSLINISNITVSQNVLTICRRLTYVTTAGNKSFEAEIQQNLHVKIHFQEQVLFLFSMSVSLNIANFVFIAYFLDGHLRPHKAYIHCDFSWITIINWLWKVCNILCWK